MVVLFEMPGEGVLASSGADDEDFHEWLLPEAEARPTMIGGFGISWLGPRGFLRHRCALLLLEIRGRGGHGPGRP